MRILVKLRNHSWLPSFVTDYLGRELTNGRKKDEEFKGKAVKVIDLLQHAAELGHTDALYTLGQVSLVSLSPSQSFVFPYFAAELRALIFPARGTGGFDQEVHGLLQKA